MIMISQSVGEGRKGTPKDIQAVEGQLRKAGFLPMVGPVHEQGLHGAIRQFQSAVGIRPDGRVDPGGGTLKALNAILEPLKITSIKPDKIANGGYKISIEPFVPGSPYKVWIGSSPAEADCVEITGRKKDDVFTRTHLDALLAIVKRSSKWGTNLPVKVYVRMEFKTISESLPANLPCPVHPHNGKLLPLDEAGNPPKLKYLGDSAKGPFYGRMLEFHQPTGVYLFKYGGVLETDPNKRGFDCITYCGTVCGASTSHMAEAGDMARSLNATVVETEIVDTASKPAQPANFVGPPVPKMKKVTLENCDPAVVKSFFDADRPGRYLMWSGGHVVLVDNKTVHEFSYSKAGYSATDVQTWLAPYKTVKLTVRSV